MAFNEIQTGVWGNKRLENCVRVYVRKDKVVNFSIASDVFDRMGRPVYVKLMVGSGEHTGFVAILPKSMPGKSVRKLIFSKADSKAVQFAANTASVGLSKTVTSSQTMPHEITEDGLIVDLRPLIDAQLAAVIVPDE